MTNRRRGVKVLDILLLIPILTTVVLLTVWALKTFNHP